MFSRFGVLIMYCASLMFVSLQMSLSLLTLKEISVTCGRMWRIKKKLCLKIFIFMAWRLQRKRTILKMILWLMTFKITSTWKVLRRCTSQVLPEFEVARLNSLFIPEYLILKIQSLKFKRQILYWSSWQYP